MLRCLAGHAAAVRHGQEHEQHQEQRGGSGRLLHLSMKAATRPGGRVGAARDLRQVEQVGAFAELEGAGDGFEHGGGGAGEVPRSSLA
jgi:hypothetical protein